MLDIYLIRHAESEMNNTLHLIGGRSNHTPLSEKGEFQAELLGKRFHDEKITFDEVYSSTAVRTLATAKIVGEQMIDFPENIVTSEELLELDQGEFEGKPRAEIYTEEMFTKINEDNWNFTPPGGESQRMVEERMYNWIKNNLIPRYEENITVGVFTHGFAIKCLMRGILDFSPKMTYNICMENTAITRLRYDKRGWYMYSFNDSGHLLGKKFNS